MNDFLTLCMEEVLEELLVDPVTTVLFNILSKSSSLIFNERLANTFISSGVGSDDFWVTRLMLLVLVLLLLFKELPPFMDRCEADEANDFFLNITPFSVGDSFSSTDSDLITVVLRAISSLIERLRSYLISSTFFSTFDLSSDMKSLRRSCSDSELVLLPLLLLSGDDAGLVSGILKCISVSALPSFSLMVGVGGVVGVTGTVGVVRDFLTGLFGGNPRHNLACLFMAS